jgi:hypothetical protein
MTTMINVINTNEKFGERGPFEVESIDALVAEYARETIPGWAHEKWMAAEDVTESKEAFIARVSEEMEEEFRGGLEIVEDRIMRSNAELKRDRESIASAMRGGQTDPLIEWIDALIAGDESHRDRAERALDKLATDAE